MRPAGKQVAAVAGGAARAVGGLRFPETPVCAGPWFAGIINYVGRLAQLIRDLFNVKCSQTEALSLLLNSGPTASIPRKVGNREGGLLRKMPSGTFLAIWDPVKELIVYYWKTAISRRRA